MVVADLHVHTTISDGTLALTEVPSVARDAGLEAVALTDHDRCQPALEAPVSRREGITLIHGIELRVTSSAGRIDLLGYGVDPNSELRRLVDRIQTDRVDRAGRMVDRVEARLGVDLPVVLDPGVGRPHVARAIAAVSEYSYQAAFDELIGDDGPCYVARELPSFETGRTILAEACRLVGLAHPLRYDDVEGALELVARLDAIERYYPYSSPADQTAVDRVIDAADLVATGGSDAHERVLGTAGLERSPYERFRERMGLPGDGS